jgi:hypothetical protein
MSRSTALCLVLALTTASASRLACVWECVDRRADAHAAAPCHEAPERGPTVAAAAATHCPLTPDEAALWVAKSSESPRTRVAHAAAAALPGPFADSTRAARNERPSGAPPPYALRPPFQSLTVLRI